MTVAFIDNSVLSEYRTRNHITLDIKKIEFLESILKKFQIKRELVFLTDRLFLEVIGYGKIRRKIEKDNKNIFLEEKSKLANSLNKEKEQIEAIIDNYLNFLENFFSNEFIRRFPQNNISAITISSLMEFRFSKILNFFNSKVIKYGFRLFKNLDFYNNFIFTLVEDSVIRYALNAINIRKITVKHHPKAFDIIGAITKKLMIRYYHSEILYTNLNLLGSALKKHIEGQNEHHKTLKPLLRVDNDFVDVELSHFPIYGKIINQNTSAVSILTKESEQTVTERLKYNFQAAGTKANIICSQSLVLGRTLILDFNNFTFKEILTEEYIKKNFRYVSGKPIE